MQSKTIKLEIITPEGLKYKDDIYFVIAPGINGYFEIQTTHAPFITTLKAGEIKIKKSEKEFLYLAVSGGFLEIKNDKVAILADTAELANEIDIERAKKAKENATEAIENPNNKNHTIINPQLALERAETRLKVAEKTGNNSQN